MIGLVVTAQDWKIEIGTGQIAFLPDLDTALIHRWFNRMEKDLKVGPASILGRSFELRAFSTDHAANGETDFKGETAVFTTEERIEYLRRYAAIAGDFFQDPHWDRLAVEPQAIAAAVARLKPAPEPEVRQRISLDKWRWNAQVTEESLYPVGGLEPTHVAGTVVADGALLWQRPARYSVGFSQQSWRAFFWVEFYLPANGQEVVVDLESVVRLQVAAGRPLQANSQVSEQVLPPGGGPVALKIELDFASEGGRFNVEVDGVRWIQWQPVSSTARCQRLTISADQGFKLVSCRGLGFGEKVFTEDIGSRDEPYSFHPLFRHTFRPEVDLEGWWEPAYDDRSWESTGLPCVHGGVMEAGEYLLLRTQVQVPACGRVMLNVESLDPGGEVWVNGQWVHLQKKPQSFRLDISDEVKVGAVNWIAIRVHHNRAHLRMRHTSADRYTGWFLGRVSLDCQNEVFVEDLFVHTGELTDTHADVIWKAQLRNLAWGEEELEPLRKLVFHGEVELTLAPWYPQDGEVAARMTMPVRASYAEPVELTDRLRLENPQLWNVDSPRLYRARIVLRDSQGQELDDYVTTFGVRTVSQEEGIFRINGKPAMMNGGLLFGMRPPIEDQSRHLRCGSIAQLVRDVLTVKAMGGNTIRMSVHDGPYKGINDARLAEIGDQLGILFQWTTNEWVRTSSAWQISFEGLAQDIRQVRNHPSIVMWQPGNHPKFVDWESEAAKWYSRVVETILSVDTSRLISPTANSTQLNAPSDDGTISAQGNPIEPTEAWTHPLVVRGNMDTPTGYGAEWSVLRTWPNPPTWDGDQGWVRTGFRFEHLQSTKHAYFDFESEESAAQPNWDLHKGQPYYRIRSYELNYDVGSIGRRLDCDEWVLSQAWQAFSAYEAYRKKRCLDYDGMAWCTFDGGGNSGTYEKPVTDALGYKKMAFYALRMAFQPLLAGSADVDVAYGPEDSIHPVVFNLGPEQKVELLIEVRDEVDELVASRRYTDILLPAGRSQLRLESWRPDVPADGLYAIYYTMQK